ncbi:hypothetical protein [Streptomyces sp. MI02-7b]|uniref:hypothetical protein n=1 Tax=Streptomyces sp. MI02-7b TaxID=462941 RepID=UPI0029A1759C|nr:hypothetical protein [Streptomyces sp. MI02-7b]MDX3077852.1 hypothetical protein [Streptomyces sp. MI02-7b]
MDHLLSILSAAEEAGVGPDVSKVIGKLGQYGPVGLFLILLLIGFIVPKWAIDALTREKDNWRTAFEQERAAHQVTREQLAKAEERGDVAIEQGKAMTRRWPSWSTASTPAHRTGGLSAAFPLVRCGSTPFHPARVVDHQARLWQPGRPQDQQQVVLGERSADVVILHPARMVHRHQPTTARRQAVHHKPCAFHDVQRAAQR